MTHLLLLLPLVATAQETRPVGRYLDQSILVHQPSQLNPLHQVASLTFTDRMTVTEAVRTALAGTGYRLDDPGDGRIAVLLADRIALSHRHFANRRIDSVVAALIGVGRGVDVRVNHLHRRLRVVPAAGGPG